MQGRCSACEDAGAVQRAPQPHMLSGPVAAWLLGVWGERMEAGAGPDDRGGSGGDTEGAVRREERMRSIDAVPRCRGGGMSSAVRGGKSARWHLSECLYLVVHRRGIRQCLQRRWRATAVDAPCSGNWQGPHADTFNNSLGGQSTAHPHDSCLFFDGQNQKAEMCSLHQAAFIRRRARRCPTLTVRVCMQRRRRRRHAAAGGGVTDTFTCPTPAHPFPCRAGLLPISTWIYFGGFGFLTTSFAPCTFHYRIPVRIR
jgi:hypothetical protein